MYNSLLRMMGVDGTPELEEIEIEPLYLVY